MQVHLAYFGYSSGCQLQVGGIPGDLGIWFGDSGGWGETLVGYNAIDSVFLSCHFSCDFRGCYVGLQVLQGSNLAPPPPETVFFFFFGV